MCGIYGEVTLQPGVSPGRDQVVRSGSLLTHRGPDADGLFIDGRAALGLRRLAIIDPAGGEQPIYNEDRSIVAVCNGEIYNFRELRAELEALGHSVRSNSDAEVLVHLYEEYGDEMPLKLRGMFGFALWDSARQRALIGRDRLGIKPVYYARLGNRLAFASEVKALTGRADFNASLDRNALVDYLALGYVANPATLLAGVEKLRPGHYLVVENGTASEHCYWRLGIEPAERSVHDWADEIRSALVDSVERQLISDVPLGAFLSGGIDSSMIVASMRQADPTGSIATYAIGYQGSTGANYYNETDYARQVAQAFDTQHKEILVSPEIVRLLPELVWHMDEPTADAALVTTSLVAEYAARDVKVILSGVGGDELFGGYDRYMLGHYLGLMQRLPGWCRRHIVNPLAGALPVSRSSRILNLFRYLRTLSELTELSDLDRYHRLMEVFGSSQLSAMLGPRAVGEPDALARALTEWQHVPELTRIFAADTQTQLTDDLLLMSDKMTMAHSLECRVPLLDERMVDLAGTLPDEHRVRGRETRYALRRALKDFVPDVVLSRKKRGFGPPMGGWLKHELAPVLSNLLSPEVLRRRGIFRVEAVADMINAHRANRADNSDQLFALLTLELWMRLFLDGESVADLTASVAEQGVRAA